MTADLSTKKEDKNSTFIEDLPTFDSLVRSPGSTFFTEIFIPIFINSIFQYNLLENYDKIKKEENAKLKEMNKIFLFWWDKILKIQETNTNFLSILSIRLSLAILDSIQIMKTTPIGGATHGFLSRKEVEWRLYVCTSWFDKLVIHIITKIFSNEKKKKLYTNIDFYNEVKRIFRSSKFDKEKSVLFSIVNKYESLIENCKYESKLHEILLLIKMINSKDFLQKSVFIVIDCIGLKGNTYLESGGPRSFNNINNNDNCNNDSSDNNNNNNNNNNDNSDDENNNNDRNNTSNNEKKRKRIDMNGKETYNFEYKNDDDNDSNDDDNDNNDDDNDDNTVQCNNDKNCSNSNSSSCSVREIFIVNDIRCDQDVSAPSSVETHEQEHGHGQGHGQEQNRRKGPGRGRGQTVPKSGWYRCADFTPWPIGVLPGESLESTSRCPLYLLQEVRD